MASQRGRLGLALVLIMFMSGCIYADTPEWGKGDGQIFVEIDEDSADISSKMGDDDFDETVSIVGCEGTKFKLSGLLISSQLYSNHPELDNIESSMGAAVIIHTMSYSAAENVEDGSAGRIDIKDWSSPINPTESVGSKLSTNEDEWEVVGIIPASENVADGLNVLQHWHQAIELRGYIVETDGVESATDEGCELDGQGHAMIVTNIKTEQGVVSLDGNSDDEYSLGDTDIFGGWTFILFFLVVGFGGGTALYIVSTMMIRQGARATAEALLGREGFAKALQMKEDLKREKKSRRKETSYESSPPQKKPQPKPKKKQEDVAIPGFSLDSVLSSDNDDSVPQTFGGGSVVVTSEAKEMEKKTTASNVVTSTQIGSPMPSSNVVSSQPEPAQRGHFSASMTSSRSSSQTPPATDEPKPVRRRTVKKRSVKPATVEETQEPVAETRASITDDEEFSDFSF